MKDISFRSGPSSYFAARSVSLSSDGNFLAVELAFLHSSIFEVSKNSRVQVYGRQESAEAWIRRGFPFFGEIETDEFVTVLSRDGVILGVGAPLTGQVRTFKWLSNRRRWMQFGYELEDSSVQTMLGESMTLSALSDETLVFPVGAPVNDTTSQHVGACNKVHLYQRPILYNQSFYYFTKTKKQSLTLCISAKIRYLIDWLRQCPNYVVTPSST
jgi:hypothetical protein